MTVRHAAYVQHRLAWACLTLLHLCPTAFTCMQDIVEATKAEKEPGFAFDTSICRDLCV